MSDADRPRLWLPWVVALCVGAVATPVSVWGNQARERAVREHEARIAEQSRVDNAALQRVEAVWKKIFQENGMLNPSRSQAEAALNGGKPFGEGWSMHRDQREVAYRDPDSGATVYLRFSGDGWFWSRIDASRPLTPRPTQAADVLEIARRLAYMAGFLLAGLLLLATVVRSPAASVRAGHWFAAVSVGATWLALLGPRYGRSWCFFRQEDSAGWGVLILIPVAAGLLVRAYVGGRGGPNHPVCPECGYNLTGNESGLCPECGHAAVKAATSTGAAG